jgi:hypothetical protein
MLSSVILKPRVFAGSVVCDGLHYALVACRKTCPQPPLFLFALKKFHIKAERLQFLDENVEGFG